MNLKELNLSTEEYEKIIYIAKLFKCQKMTVEDIFK